MDLEARTIFIHEESELDFLPEVVKSLDLSELGSISNDRLTRISKMQIEILNLSNLQLQDGDLENFPEGIKVLTLSNNEFQGKFLWSLPDSLNYLDVIYCPVTKRNVWDSHFLVEKYSMTLEADPPVLNWIAQFYKSVHFHVHDIERYLVYLNKSAKRGEPESTYLLALNYQWGLRYDRKNFIRESPSEGRGFHDEAMRLGCIYAKKIF